ncbi:MAG: sulfotransferase family protein, partial [Candidatus Binatia bacterium]
MARPIFIVGMPRSGSTVFYNTLAKHPEVAWVSQASKKFPRSLLLTRFIMAFRADRRPTEGHRIWRRYVRAEDDSLRREHVTAAQRRYYTTLVDMHVRLHGKPRFLSKYPRNVLRFEYLDEIFPDALFLHLIRDGRAVAQSVLQMRDGHGGRNLWWGIRPPGWRTLERLEPVESVGLQWKMTIEYARKSAASLSPARYLEIR